MITREEILKELANIQKADYARLSDKQLWQYEKISINSKGTQPIAFRKYNQQKKRTCKLSEKKVQEIRSKFQPGKYGKKKLAKEYGVSASVILRIVKGIAWRPTKI